ncbi:MAG: hypothetical protein CL917_12840 [Deltaproteobacteria bacterium]|nr:hypothetical protein [Deltaproteobacteria bacterium]
MQISRPVSRLISKIRLVALFSVVFFLALMRLALAETPELPRLENSEGTRVGLDAEQASLDQASSSQVSCDSGSLESRAFSQVNSVWEHGFREAVRSEEAASPEDPIVLGGTGYNYGRGR